MTRVRSARKAGRPKLFVRDFVLTVSANFFLFLTFTSFYLLPLIIQKMGGDEVDIGSMSGAGWLAAGVFMVAMGGLLDRWGRKGFLLGGIALLAGASLGFLAVGEVGLWMWVLRVLQGMGMATGFNAASALVADLAPVSRRGEGYGVFLVSTLSAHAVGPVIGERVMGAGGFPAFFAVVAGYGIVALFLGAFLRAPRAGRTSSPGASLAALSVRPGLWTILAASFLFGASFAAVLTFVPTYLKSRGFATVGFFFLAYTASAVVVRAFFSTLSDRWGRRRVILPSLGGMVVVLVLLALARGTATFVAAGVLFGMSQGFFYPTMGALTMDRVSAGDRGRVLGLFNGSFHLGVFAGSSALGPVAAWAGYPAMYGVSAAVAFGCVLLFVRFDPSAATRRETA